jgi:hypothetical protein
MKTSLINIHKKDKTILNGIQAYFEGIGNFYKHGEDGVQYLVSSVNDLSKIVDHFDKYPLITKKQADFFIFKKILDLIKCKEHLTISGLQKIVNLRVSMNNGLSDTLKVAFPNTIPVQRPFIQNHQILDPNWLAGLTTAEGCFYAHVYKSTTKLGRSVLLGFVITQHLGDEQSLRNLVQYLGCGKVYIRSKQTAVDFKITRLELLLDKIIPFFEKYPLSASKASDFAAWCKIALLIKK